MDRSCEQTRDALAAAFSDPNILLDEELVPGTAPWTELRKHGIALHLPYCAPNRETLGPGLTTEDLEEQLGEGPRPCEMQTHFVTQNRSAHIRARYACFLKQPYTDVARLMVAWTLDTWQVRRRAWTAAAHSGECAVDWGHDVEIISLACGATGPIARLSDGVIEDGHDIASLQLVDRVPVALAAGRAIARQQLDPARVYTQFLDLVDLTDGSATHLADHLGTHRAHLIDVLSFFTYLPDATAASSLREARHLLRPDGGIVLANMLDIRPQQDVVSDLITWPPLVQRAWEQLLGVIADAGFDLAKVTLATAREDEAVYAVASLRR